MHQACDPQGDVVHHKTGITRFTPPAHMVAACDKQVQVYGQAVLRPFVVHDGCWRLDAPCFSHPSHSISLAAPVTPQPNSSTQLAPTPNSYDCWLHSMCPLRPLTLPHSSPGLLHTSAGHVHNLPHMPAQVDASLQRRTDHLQLCRLNQKLRTTKLLCNHLPLILNRPLFPETTAVP